MFQNLYFKLKYVNNKCLLTSFLFLILSATSLDLYAQVSDKRVPSGDIRIAEEGVKHHFLTAREFYCYKLNIDTTFTRILNDPSYRGLVFKFGSNKINKKRDIFEIIGYAVKDGFNNSSKVIVLEKNKFCLNTIRNHSYYFGNNVISLDKLRAAIAGNKNTKYIKLTPFLNDRNQIIYNIYFFDNNDGPIILKTLEIQTVPCPPADCFF